MPKRSPPDKRKRWPEQPAPRTSTLTADETRKVSAIVADHADRGAMVVDLAERRARRLLADLDLTPTVPVPCGPCCRCYGTPMGAGCGP